MKKALVAFLLLFSFIAQGADNSSMNVIKSEENFTVSLAANPTTGYVWSVTNYDKDLLSLKGSLYQKAQNNLIGAGGQMRFTFALNKGKVYPDKTSISFKYARPWEHEGATEQKVTVNFVNAM